MPPHVLRGRPLAPDQELIHSTDRKTVGNWPSAFSIWSSWGRGVGLQSFEKGRRAVAAGEFLGERAPGQPAEQPDERRGWVGGGGGGSRADLEATMLGGGASRRMSAGQ